MVLEADLSKVSLPKVLLTLAKRRATGILTVQGEEDIVAVSCLNGAVVAADALNETVEDGLGNVLTKQGLVTSKDFAAAAQDHQGGSDGSLGEFLVARGLIQREQLLEALRTQTFRLMLQTLTWRQGELKFYGGDEVSYEPGIKPLAVEELLIRAVEDLGERSGVASRVPPLDIAYRALPSASEARIIGRDGDGSGPGTWITDNEAKLLKELDGQVRAEILLRGLGMDRFVAQFAILQLQQKRLIEGIAAGSASAKGQKAVAGRKTGMAVESHPDKAPSTDGIEDESSAMARPHLEPEIAALNPWIGPGLAAFLFVAVALVALSRPISMLLPFPWQEIERSTAEHQVRRSLFLKIDQAARTYFLQRAHYPDALQNLVEEGLLAPIDLLDPAGYQVVYSPAPLSYEIDLQDRNGEIVEGLGLRGSIDGDLLLDPQFAKLDAGAEAPLYLIE